MHRICRMVRDMVCPGVGTSGPGREPPLRRAWHSTAGRPDAVGV